MIGTRAGILEGAECAQRRGEELKTYHLICDIIPIVAHWASLHDTDTAAGLLVQ